MQSLKSIREAEVDNFFKQSFEQKKTDSTVDADEALRAKRSSSPLSLFLVLNKVLLKSTRVQVV